MSVPDNDFRAGFIAGYQAIRAPVQPHRLHRRNRPHGET